VVSAVLRSLAAVAPVDRDGVYQTLRTSAPAAETQAMSLSRLKLTDLAGWRFFSDFTLQMTMRSSGSQTFEGEHPYRPRRNSGI